MRTIDSPTEDSSWYVYIVKCADGSLYTGTAKDIDKRIILHNSGKGAKYTRSRAPVALVYSEEFPDRSAACKRESEIKTLTRQQKEALVAQKSRASVDTLLSE